MGDMACTAGEIYLEDLDSGFGYVAQSPWLQRGTIRDNILWGAVYEETRYRNVLYACALQEDLEDLGGDLIGVGEAGRTLSGGQRARIALARAVYQDKQIYLFDDVLSALDAHVANHVIKYCFMGILKNKTRIIVSEHKSILRHATQILRIENGTVTQQTQANPTDNDSTDLSDSQQRDDSRMVNIKLANPDEDNRSVSSILQDETKEQGTLSSSVFLAYWKAMSSPLALAVLISIITMQSSRNLSDVWLAHWVDHSTFQNSSVVPLDTKYYLSIYSGLVSSNSFLTLIRAFVFAYTGIHAAKFIHSKLLKSVFYVSILLYW